MVSLEGVPIFKLLCKNLVKLIRFWTQQRL